MVKFKNNEVLKAKIEKITFKTIHIGRLAPDEENNKYIYVTFYPISVTPMIRKRYPIITEGESCDIGGIECNLLQFMEELYDIIYLNHIDHKGTVVISIPWALVSCYKPCRIGEYWYEVPLEVMDTIHELVLSCNDEAYEKYKQKILDDIKDSFKNFKPKIYTDDDWRLLNEVVESEIKMTKEEAIEKLKEFNFIEDNGDIELQEAFDIAIKALEKVPYEDTISSQAILDLINHYYRFSSVNLQSKDRTLDDHKGEENEY